MQIIKTLSGIFLFNFYCFSQSISSFENKGEWQIVSSEGAEIETSINEGYSGKSLKIDYAFTGAGWCGIEKVINLELPEDYKFSYYLKGISPKNNLEFKLVDSTGDNVWWLNQRNFEFPSEWTYEVVRKRNIEFAWGPSGGGEMKKAHKLQIIIAASEGGKGTIFLDELKFEIVTAPDTTIKPKITASSLTGNNLPANTIDQNFDTKWKTKEKDEWLLFDFGYIKEFGGIIVTWDKNSFTKSFNVEISNDGSGFRKIYEKSNVSGINDFIPIKNGEARFIKFNLNDIQTETAIKEIEIQPLNFSDDKNYFMRKVSEYFPKGFFPKYFNNIQSYWNIIGVSGDTKEGLINEEGAIEVDKGSFCIEPFIFTNNKLITWADVQVKQKLEEDYIPVPSVLWENDSLQLQIKTFAAGKRGESFIAVEYKLSNKTDELQNYSLYLAVRPYQVNPPWQFLNTVGGVSKINEISYENSIIKIDNKKVISLNEINNFAASEFKDGEIINYINNNSLPDEQNINDPTGFGSAAAKYNLEIPAQDSKSIFIVVPFHKDYPVEINKITPASAENFYNKKLSKTISFWKDHLNRVEINLPGNDQKIFNILKSNLAYILINRDGPAIQPGSRSYERAWIRDGALTSSALLRLGLKEEVKEYLDWYSQYQFPSGKIPCVVDNRGADPTPENDSHGEYIFALLQYFLFSKDTSFLKEKFNSIVKTVDYIEYLTNQRKTPQYQKKDSLMFFGLMPESISHEGYSAKPMHSYWDDFFTLRGLKDAVTAASILNEEKAKERFIQIRDDFENNLYNSINLSMKLHNINYIPGCAELGDFDATSTTISIYPGGELNTLPQPELQNTFEKYYENFSRRKNSEFDWNNYTPYEIRAAGTFLYLEQKEKAFELLDYFFNHQRPAEWNHWAEVVWRDKNEPRFIGDMPHTWISSDYISVVRSIFIFERESDSSLILGLGLKEEWADQPEGIKVKNLHSYYGNINYSLKKEDNTYKINVSGNVDLLPGKIIFKNFKNVKPDEVLINGENSKNYNEKEIILNSLPCEITIKY